MLYTFLLCQSVFGDGWRPLRPHPAPHLLSGHHWMPSSLHGTHSSVQICITIRLTPEQTRLCHTDVLPGTVLAARIKHPINNTHLVLFHLILATKASACFRDSGSAPGQHGRYRLSLLHRVQKVKACLLEVEIDQWGASMQPRTQVNRGFQRSMTPLPKPQTQACL